MPWRWLWFGFSTVAVLVLMVRMGIAVFGPHGVVCNEMDVWAKWLYDLSAFWALCFPRQASAWLVWFSPFGGEHEEA